jgi:hypothetical protein
MPSSENILQQISGHTSQSSLPPVELWNPDFCGDMNMQIKSNGDWWHEGTPIGRKKLFKLFSTIIKKEDDDYFLVTPVEKIGIKVEWKPFVIIDFDVKEINSKSVFQFTDNCDNVILLEKPNQLELSLFKDEKLPIINVRRNLYASFTRSCYYRLIDTAEPVEKNGITVIKIKSNGHDFILGEFNESSI